MKKILIIILPAIILLGSSQSVYAVGSSSNRASTPSTQNQNKTQSRFEQQEEGLKNRGIAEIQRRITALNKLMSKVGLMEKLTDEQKKSYQSQIQNEINSLVLLQAKIESNNGDLTSLKTDVQSIVTSYRVYAFFMPAINLLITADRIDLAAQNLNNLAEKLARRVNEAQSTDNTQLESSISGIFEMTTLAEQYTQKVRDQITPLSPQGYPDNRETLQNARTTLDGAAKFLKEGRQLAQEVIKQLK